MQFIDTHTHTWGHNTDELPWKASVLPPEWDGPYTHQALIDDMDALGIDKSVIVTTPAYGRGIRANEYTMRSIEAHPDQLFGVGLMDFFDDETTLRNRVRQVVGHDRMLGIRMHSIFEYAEIPQTVNRDADWIADDQLDPVWDELENQDAALFIFPKAEQIAMIAELVKDHPNVPVVIDHMGWPDETTAPNEAPWTDFRQLSNANNTYVKVSSLPRSAATPWPYEDLHGYVRNLVEWFGPERLMLGSDYPWMSSWADYEECLSWIHEVEFLSARDLSYLTHRTFHNLHRS